MTKSHRRQICILKMGGSTFPTQSEKKFNPTGTPKHTDIPAPFSDLTTGSVICDWISSFAISLSAVPVPCVGYNYSQLRIIRHVVNSDKYRSCNYTRLTKQCHLLGQKIQPLLLIRTENLVNSVLDFPKLTFFRSYAPNMSGILFVVLGNVM